MVYKVHYVHKDRKTKYISKSEFKIKTLFY